MTDEMHDPIPEGEEAPPRGVRAMAIVRWVILGAVVAAALFTVGGWLLARRGSPREGTAASVSEEHHSKYHCPMHPQIVSDQPGQCPICQMTLVPLDAAKAPGATTSSVAGLAVVEVPGERLQAMGCGWRR